MNTFALRSMVNIAGDLLCLYTADIDTTGDTYTIEVPKRELELGQLDHNEPAQVALFSTPTASPNQRSNDQSATQRSHSESPPVEEGEIVDVEIDSLGDQGDGIGRVGPGYVLIVPETDVGERVSVRITETKDNVAFAEVVKRYDPR
jgi:predicted RNA-binding protein with TRAM domain